MFAYRVQAGGVVLKKNAECIFIIVVEGFCEGAAGIEQGGLEIAGDKAPGDQRDESSTHGEESCDATEDHG